MAVSGVITCSVKHKEDPARTFHMGDSYSVGKLVATAATIFGGP